MEYPKAKDRLIMVVAQEPFGIDANQFCKLVPAIYPNGIRPDPSDFPNDGEIWWMLTQQTAALAVPGSLVIGDLEPAVRYDEDDPAASKFQVERDTVRQLDMKDGLEIVSIPGDQMNSLQEVAFRSLELKLPYRVSPRVFLKWRSEVFGPFTSSAPNDGLATATRIISLVPTNADSTVFSMDWNAFKAAVADYLVELRTDVSTGSQRRKVTLYHSEVVHELLLGSGYERFLSQHPKRLLVESVDRKLNRFARNCLTRRKRQDLQQLLQEIELNAPDLNEPEDVVQVLRRVRNQLTSHEDALEKTAKALLESGLLGEDRIKRAEEGFAKQYVAERAVALNAQIEEKVNTVREELKRTEAELANKQLQLKQQEQAARIELDKMLAAKHREALARLDEQNAELAKRQDELKRQEGILHKNLAKVTQEFRDAGDDVVNRFLTIAPLIGIGLPRLSPPVEQRRESAAAINNAVPKRSSWSPPSFVLNSSSARAEVLKEDAFFARFAALVEKSGFVYRQLDLQRFHLSVKAGVTTVLGGPSGIGKSSLPLLYARALAGEESEQLGPDCLMVNVSPQWLDVRDLLGHVNTAEGRFYPAESGLFQHLVSAQEEFTARRSASRLYLACLDEMNLSQVEHYFSDLMMVLEREGEIRTLRAFSPGTIPEDEPFHKYGDIRLSPALRFTGTVNFDETTRVLSDRFLDRVNLIQLKVGSLPATTGGSSVGLTQCLGPAVRLVDFESWVGDGNLPPDLAALLDQLRPVFQALGCPVSARVLRGICRFVSSCRALMSPASAFDLQLAQRVVPRVRGLFSKRKYEALDQLMKILTHNTACSFEETLPLLEEIREVCIAQEWNAED